MNEVKAREIAIENISAAFKEAGYGGSPMIVYRDTVKIGLALAFLSAANMDARVKIDESLTWCVIGTKTSEDNNAIRKGVDDLQNFLEQRLERWSL